LKAAVASRVNLPLNRTTVAPSTVWTSSFKPEVGTFEGFVAIDTPVQIQIAIC
jgi:hypothetical protein